MKNPNPQQEQCKNVSDGSREAVEGSIDLSKGERVTTWEGVSRRSSVKRWDEDGNTDTDKKDAKLVLRTPRSKWQQAGDAIQKAQIA